MHQGQATQLSSTSGKVEVLSSSQEGKSPRPLCIGREASVLPLIAPGMMYVVGDDLDHWLGDNGLRVSFSDSDSCSSVNASREER